jgi:hypothetical protein
VAGGFVAQVVTTSLPTGPKARCQMENGQKPQTFSLRVEHRCCATALARPINYQLNSLTK